MQGKKSEPLSAALTAYTAQQAYAIIRTMKAEDLAALSASFTPSSDTAASAAAPSFVNGGEDLASLTQSTVAYQAIRLLYNLSCANFDGVYQKIGIRLKSLALSNEDDPELEELIMIPFLHFNVEELKRLLQGECLALAHTHLNTHSR
jgi:hypothetical protein